MDTKITKRITALLLMGAFLLTLSACGSNRNPTATAQISWEDPTPEVHGSIENGIYTNQWLNLTAMTTTDVAFLEEYNRASSLADPQRNRWCELYEHEEDGSSVVMTIEKLPEGATFSQVSQDYVEEFLQKLKNTENGVKLSFERMPVSTNYTFREYTCTQHSFQITSSCNGTVLEENIADFFFWEKGGYLIELQIINDFSYYPGQLFDSEEEPNPDQPTHRSGEITELFDGSKHWSGKVEVRGIPYNLHFVFEKDGTCYSAISDLELYGAGMGTYTVEGNTISVSIRMDGDSRSETYTFDPATFSLTATVGGDLFAEKGDVIFLAEHTAVDAGQIKELGKRFAEGLQDDWG